MDFKNTLHGKTLQFCSSAKYLGVTISTDLHWNYHVDTICSRAIIHSCFLTQLSTNQLPQAQNNGMLFPSKTTSGVCCPSLGFTSLRWYKGMLQDVLNRYHNTSSVSEMLEELKWHSLQQRRESFSSKCTTNLSPQHCTLHHSSTEANQTRSCPRLPSTHLKKMKTTCNPSSPEP